MHLAILYDKWLCKFLIERKTRKTSLVDLLNLKTNTYIDTDKMKQQMFGQSIFFHNQINSGPTLTHTYYKSVFYGIPTYNE